jgi:hypothetical protein
MDETPEERVERYRRMADSTRELALRSDSPEIRAAYLDLAGRWEALAQQSVQEAQSVRDASWRLKAPARRRSEGDEGASA